MRPSLRGIQFIYGFEYVLVVCFGKDIFLEERGWLPKAVGCVRIFAPNFLRSYNYSVTIFNRENVLPSFWQR